MQFKDMILELRYRERAPLHFWRLIRKGRVVESVELVDLLEEAVDRGVLSQVDMNKVTLADLIMRGQWRADGRQLLALVEISSVVDCDDVRDAADRAALLAKLGTPVMAVVAGASVTEQAAEMARSRNVWQVVEGQVVEPSDGCPPDS